jgi:hypothetical protein
MSDASRLVLEALYIKRRNTCVVRVYQTSPLEVFFARKFGLEVDSCAALLKSAVEIFAQHLRQIIPVQMRVPASLGMSTAQAMLPIPPPVDVTNIPA